MVVIFVHGASKPLPECCLHRFSRANVFWVALDRPARIARSTGSVPVAIASAIPQTGAGPFVEYYSDNIARFYAGHRVLERPLGRPSRLHHHDDLPHMVRQGAGLARGQK